MRNLIQGTMALHLMLALVDPRVRGSMQPVRFDCHSRVSGLGCIGFRVRVWGSRVRVLGFGCWFWVWQTLAPHWARVAMRTVGMLASGSRGVYVAQDADQLVSGELHAYYSPFWKYFHVYYEKSYFHKVSMGRAWQPSRTVRLP